MMDRFDLWLDGELRKRGWKQTDLAAKSGLNVSTIHYIMHDVHQPNLQTLGMILDALGMHIEFVEN